MSCRNEIRELVVWAAGTELDADERRRVEQHVADCSECRELMAFAREMGWVTRDAAHPDAETLVQWVEDSSALSPDERARVTEHVDSCASCARESAILSEVDAEAAVDTAVARAALSPARDKRESRADLPIRSRSDEATLGERLHRWFASGLANPIPAAAVLGVAIVTVALVSRGPERSGDGFVTGPTLLSDTRVAMRGGTAATPTTIQAGTSPLLLLELTDLAVPPADDAVFRVELVADASPAGASPIWQREVLGRDFADTYTLVIQLPDDALVAGRHSLRVLAPAGRIVFEAALRTEGR